MRHKVIIVLLASLFSLSTSYAKEKPNILFVFIDDMGYGDLGCYGNEEVETPNIDKLSGEGIRFDQFYVNAPICSPSRVAVTTGQYPTRWGITTFIASREQNEKRGIKDYLQEEAPSLARVLSANGYYTAHIGKWHMGGGRDIGDVPYITDYGFDESVTQFEGLGERYLATYETLDLKGDSTRRLERWSAALGKGEVHWEKRYNVTGKFVDRAIQAIENAQKEQKPFYINLWPDDVHTPLEPSPINRGGGSRHDHYLGVIKELDRELGRVFDYIKRHKELAENTLIVVTSDNGPAPGVGSAGNLRGTKTNLYEGGIREPMIVWCPSKIKDKKNGFINKKNVIAGMDLPPTFLALAGIENHGLNFDGIDVSDAILGKELPLRSEPIMWQRPPGFEAKEEIDLPDLAIREGDFKLLVNIDGTGLELYNIVEDEAETINLSEKYHELVKSMSQKVLGWYATMPPLIN